MRKHSTMIITQSTFGKPYLLTPEILTRNKRLNEMLTSNWMFDDWSCRSGGVITTLIKKLEKRAKDEGIITRKLTPKKKSYLKSLIKNCIHFKGKAINYTRGKQGKDTYASSVDLLCKLKLLENQVANNEAVSSKYSFVFDYDELLAFCCKIPTPEPLIVTIRVKKKKDSNGNKIEINRSDIPNKPLLRKLEKQVKVYNALLEPYQINHPILGECGAMSYFRVFNGGSFGAKEGGRYYSRNPVHTARNKKDSDENKPRELITVTHKETQEQYPLVRFDFTALHLNLLYLYSTGNIFSYQWSQVQSGDPYQLYENTSELQRRLAKVINMAYLGSQQAKRVVISCLNKENRAVYFKDDSECINAMSILDELGEDADGIISKTLDDYRNFHKAVLKLYKLGKQMPLALQYVDSCLATNIIQRFIELNIPVWCWHDEFLIPCIDMTEDEAKELLTNICNEELFNLRGSEELNRLESLRVNH